MADAVSSTPAGREPEVHADGLPVPRRYWSILAIWLAIGMSVLDGTIANVALPTIADDLTIGSAESIWIVNAYQLAITVALLPFASLGDKIGHRRVYMAGLIVFTLGSLGCALSQNLPQLVAARVFQGLGAAGIMAINAALVRFTYPHALLGRGMGLNAVVISIAAAVGPTAAGAILAVASWQWLFAINIPLGILTIVIGARCLPYTRGSRAKLDFLSAGLTAITFGGVIMGLEGLARDGVRYAGVLAVGLVAGVFLLRRELPLPRPLVPIDLMKIPLLRLSVFTSIVAFTAQMLAFVALPFHFQHALGRSAVETGLLMTPWPIAVGIASPIAGRLADRYPAGALGGIGLAVFAAGLALVALMPSQPQTWDIVWRMALAGIGFGLFQSPNNRAIVTSAPRDRSGAAGGLLSTGRLLGQTTGAVLMALLFHAVVGAPTVVAVAIAAAVSAAAALLSLLRLRV